ncbi:hypothetical protein XSP_001088 [Xanthomonas euroxanthea]|uniref:Uncharacterized protein n=1 Tax=Xanthomonas euroxanthea TaxID=2259622 RepID=A0A8E4GD86_9XANT|nr:hypothetical protein [Xanthomonas euroxanthea]CAD1788865.1 hypothetical protein XSP_001088 [Xanthomonas euroxanthea]SYZ52288.1 hypothetical protein CPBF367_10920 [Xanthomonas arboricola pv. juglandis]
MSAPCDSVPASSDPEMQWRRWAEFLDLVYRESPVIRICALEDGTVSIRTRAYSKGPTVTRHMATEAGALLYVGAWLLKWRGQAKSEIDNAIRSVQLQDESAAAARAEYPDLDPATFTKRRRRR